MARRCQQSAGVGTGIAVGTLRRGDQFPGSAGVFPLLPFNVTGEEKKGVDGSWIGCRNRKVNADQTRCGEGCQRIAGGRRDPSGSKPQSVAGLTAPRGLRGSNRDLGNVTGDVALPCWTSVKTKHD